jgi:hypothetical protein
LPPALLKSTPRQVRIAPRGALLMIVAAALVGIGMWGGIELRRRAETADRHVQLFASERRLAAGAVIQLRTRGGDDDDRVTARYRYTALGRELTGATTLRRGERDRYRVDSPVGVWYLPSEPQANWLDGYQPRPQAHWPATVIPLACGVAAFGMILAVRRQWNLLESGRPALATVTRIDKKRSEHGTYWVVHYEWATLGGATRSGKYRHSNKKTVPLAGQMLPILYDRDDPFRSHKYPMTFVTVTQA